MSNSTRAVVLDHASLDLGDLDLAPLREWTPKVADAMRALPELVDVESSGDEGMRQVVLDIDREAAARLGVDVRTIASVLNNSFSQRQVATLYDSLARPVQTDITVWPARMRRRKTSRWVERG